MTGLVLSWLLLGASVDVATVDRALAEAWQKQHLTPSPAADDAHYLRRVSLDLCGAIASEAEVRAFVADPAKDKRERLVDRLLSSREHALHLTNVWEGMLMTRAAKANRVDRQAFRDFLFASFSAGDGWDKIVRALIAASGRSSAGGPRNKGGVLTAPPEDEPAAGVNGAVNWELSFERNIEDLAGTVSRTFLGVQIQCAQCHDHVTEKWKQKDFQQFTAFFALLRERKADDDPPGGLTAFVVDDAPTARLARKKDLSIYEQTPPVALDGSAPTFESAASRPASMASRDAVASKRGAGVGRAGEQRDTRRAWLARWLTAAKNPWFARATVNRVWAQFLGHGFFDPVDDFRVGNAAVLPDLFQALSDELAARAFDLRWLMRTIVLSAAYARSAAQAPKTDADNRLFSVFSARPLSSEELLASMLRATDVDKAFAEDEHDALEKFKRRIERQFTFLFDVDDETAGERRFDSTIEQALLMLNGPLTNRAARARPGGALQELIGRGSDEDTVRALYLRTFGRMPDAAELALHVTAVHDKPKPRKQRYFENLLWALLCASEFSFNH